VSFTSSQPERRSSWGAELGDRTMALNGFQYTALDPTVALEWVRNVSAREVWKVSADVAWPAAGVNLWSYLAGDAWAGLPETTRPHEGGDTDSLALPATDRILLVQMEPRAPATDSQAGEVQRLAVYYDTPSRSWKAWQWSVPKGGAEAEAVEGGVLRRVNGKWVLDTDPAAVADGYLVVVGGKPVVDDAAVSGQVVRKAPRHIYTF
jgi:hypothetical protein